MGPLQVQAGATAAALVAVADEDAAPILTERMPSRPGRTPSGLAGSYRTVEGVMKKPSVRLPSPSPAPRSHPAAALRGPFPLPLPCRWSAPAGAFPCLSVPVRACRYLPVPSTLHSDAWSRRLGLWPSAFNLSVARPLWPAQIRQRHKKLFLKKDDGTAIANKAKKGA